MTFCFFLSFFLSIKKNEEKTNGINQLGAIWVTYDHADNITASLELIFNVNDEDIFILSRLVYTNLYVQ